MAGCDFIRQCLKSRVPVFYTLEHVPSRRVARTISTGAPAGSLYLVLFAPASTEQFPWSLGCDVSQVVIDCVSEAAILLLMHAQ